MHLQHIIDTKMIRLVHNDEHKPDEGLWKARQPHRDPDPQIRLEKSAQRQIVC
jgi:hypothetical protein